MSKSKEDKNQKVKMHAESYKLVILRSDTFLEIASIELSVRNLYIILSGVLLVIAACIVMLIAFTPLKKLIPGYGDIEANEKVLSLIEGVDLLGAAIEANDVYIEALNNILVNVDGASKETGEGSIMDQSENPRSSRSVLVPSSRHASARENELNLGIYEDVLNRRIVKPVNGIVSSEFKPSIKHYGIDILAPANSVIVASLDGYVFSSSWDIETGNTIGIQHEGDILSFYKHNSLLLKEKGTFVRAGEAIAVIGNTGTLSNGPHLHFELWHNGKAINPKELINFN